MGGAKSLMGMLPMALGAGSQLIAPGNPIGLGAMAGGAGGGGGLMSGLGSMFGGGSTLGEGARSMLGMAPSSTQQLLNLSSGQYGGAGADPLLQQGAGDLATYEGAPNAPGFRPVPGQAPQPTGQMYGGGGGAPPQQGGFQMPSLGGMGQQGRPQQPPTPSFKGPIAQAPIAPKGMTAPTSITPSVGQVPTPPTPPTTGAAPPQLGANAQRLLQMFQQGG